MNLDLEEEKAGLDKLCKTYQSESSIDGTAFRVLVQAALARMCAKEPWLGQERDLLDSWLGQSLRNALERYDRSRCAHFHGWAFIQYWDARKRTVSAIRRNGGTVPLDESPDDEAGNSQSGLASEAMRARAFNAARREREKENENDLIERLFGQSIFVVTALHKRVLFRRLAMPPASCAAIEELPLEIAPPTVSAATATLLRRYWWRVCAHRTT